LQEIFTVPLTENQAAFVYLGYSAAIVRTTKGAVIIDPANLLPKEDLQALQGKQVDAVLFTRSHGNHFKLNAAVDLAKATGAKVGVERS
jgi:L-ascorbate metabolism protein UlaG (beta-lactamase superfamily)